MNKKYILLIIALLMIASIAGAGIRINQGFLRLSGDGGIQIYKQQSAATGTYWTEAYGTLWTTVYGAQWTETYNTEIP